MDTVTIPTTEYETLLKASKWLAALEAAGVGDWPGCDLALDLVEEDAE